MNAKNPKFAIVPKGEYNSLKGGQKYKIIRFIGDYFFIVSPLTGQEIYCAPKGCHHLDGKNWILRNK